MKAMILAAGYGERMRPLTDSTPKPMLRVGGKPLIQYHVERLAAAGCESLVINISWLGEQLEEFLGDGSGFGIPISYSREESPLETAGGIKRALPLLGEAPFLVVNGDIWTDYPFQQLLAGDFTHLRAHLVLVSNPQQHPQGDFTLAADGLVDSGEGQRYTFAGISVLAPDLFAGLAKESAPLAPLLRDQGPSQVSGEYYQGLWFDVGTPDRLQALDIQVQQVSNTRS